MSDIEIIRAALLAFATVPQVFFDDNFETLQAATVALNRIEKILEEKK